MAHINQTTIPIVQKEDRLIWKNNASGELTLKDAYLFHSPAGPKRSWAKLIWNAAIPPSKSFLVWRLIHRKMPTDDNLYARGCYMPSMCTLCGKDAETSNHLFLNCQFALSLWQWLQSIVGYNIDLSYLLIDFEVSKRGWSPQSY